MSKETCETCKFWNKQESNIVYYYRGNPIKGARVVGLCRIRSPNKENWSTVSKDAWCGEFERKVDE